jgi:hypothetical protein
VACRDKVDLEATFSGWESAPRLGLLLNAGPNETGYSFLLVPPPALPPPDRDRPRKADNPNQPRKPGESRPPKKPAPPSLGKALKSQEGLRMEIRRGGVLLRSQRVRVQPGPLQMRAWRNGNRLRFEVKDSRGLQALDCQDVFALGDTQAGVFGLCWPAGVRLDRLQGWRQVLSRTPSPLERGDEFSGQKRYKEALLEYRKTASATRDVRVQQEALCKAGLCLEALGQADEAAGLFEAVAAAEGQRWPLLAGCQLWPIRIRQQKFAEADLLFRRLHAQLQGAEAAALMPEQTRRALRTTARWLIRGYREGPSYYLVRYDPQRARHLERASQVEAFLQEIQPEPEELQLLQLTLIRGYSATGQNDRAFKTAEGLAAALDPLPPHYRIVALKEYVELLIQKKTPGPGLPLVNRYLLTPQGEFQVAYLPLLLERARLQAALAQWQQAEKDLDFLLQHLSDQRHVRMEASLVRGFLRQRRGDQTGAQSDWRLGWDTAKAMGNDGGLRGSMLGSLAGAITEAEAEQLVQRAMGEVNRVSVVASLLKRKHLTPAFLAAVLSERWQSPRGREYARQVALGTLPYPQGDTIVYALTLLAGFHQGALPGEWHKEQEELAWQLSLDLLKGFSQTGKFTEAMAFQGLFAWTGVTNLFGWGGLVGKLDRSVRGPLAYVMGHRRLRLQQSADAVKLFRTARDNAPAGSTLRRLAEAELARLEAK